MVQDTEATTAQWWLGSGSPMTGHWAHILFCTEWFWDIEAIAALLWPLRRPAAQMIFYGNRDLIDLQPERRWHLQVKPRCAIPLTYGDRWITVPYTHSQTPLLIWSCSLNSSDQPLSEIGTESEKASSFFISSWNINFIYWFTFNVVSREILHVGQWTLSLEKVE